MDLRIGTRGDEIFGTFVNVPSGIITSCIQFRQITHPIN